MSLASWGCHWIGVLLLLGLLTLRQARAGATFDPLATKLFDEVYSFDQGSQLMISAPTLLPSAQPQLAPTAKVSFQQDFSEDFSELLSDLVGSGESQSQAFSESTSDQSSEELSSTLAVFLPTIAPTFSPTDEPAVIPSAATTAAPSFSAPSIAPTESPTFTPSAAPTDIPTSSISPTRSTIHPSISPTQATFLTPTIIPTLTPSRITEVTRSPSAAPSLQSQPIISFVSVLSFANSTNQTLSRDQQAVLLNATATSMGVQEDDCTVASITSTPTRRRLVHGLSELMLQIQDRLCGNMRGSAVASIMTAAEAYIGSNDSDEAFQNHRSTDVAAIDVRSKGVLSSHRVLQEENQLYSIDVEVLTTLNLVDFESADPSELYTSLTNRLEEAVRTGSYAESMQKASTAKGVAITLGVVGVRSLSLIVQYPPTTEPTPAPPRSRGIVLGQGSIIAIAVGGAVVFVVLLISYYYLYSFRSGKVYVAEGSSKGGADWYSSL